MTGPRRARGWMIAFVVGLSAAGAAIACTAGDELVYAGPAPAAGSDGGVEAAGPPVEGGALVGVASQNDGGLVPSIRQVACSSLDPDGGCDPTAGMGCCLAAASDTSGSNNGCFDQAQHYASTACKDDGDVFLTCLASTADSTCCWQRELPTTRMNTRFRTDCDGGVEACDPESDGGGTCSNGASCTSTVCKGVVVGYCGGGTAPCTP